MKIFFSHSQKILWGLSWLAIIIFGFIFSYMVWTLHGGMEWFSYLAELLLIIWGINMIITIVSYFKDKSKLSNIIILWLVLLFAGYLLYMFKDTQENYNFFLTCMYLDFGIIASIGILINRWLHLPYKKKYLNTIFIGYIILQIVLLFWSIYAIGSYASNFVIPALILWLWCNVCLLSLINPQKIK